MLLLESLQRSMLIVVKTVQNHETVIITKACVLKVDFSLQSCICYTLKILLLNIFPLQTILSMLVTRHVFLLYYFPGFHISNTWSWVSFYRNILIRMPWAKASWKSSARPPLGGLSSTLNWRGQKETYNALRTPMRSRQAPKVRSTAFLDYFLSRDHSSTDIKLIPLELILSAERRSRWENWNTSFREGSNLWTGPNRRGAL